MMIPDREGADSRPNPNLLMQFFKRLGQVYFGSIIIHNFVEMYPSGFSAEVIYLTYFKLNHYHIRPISPFWTSQLLIPYQDGSLHLY